MNPPRTAWSRLRALFRKEQLDAEMTEEMRLHIEMQTLENVAEGMSPEQARKSALRQFGWMESIKQTCREQRSVSWLEDLVQESQAHLPQVIFAGAGAGLDLDDGKRSEQQGCQDADDGDDRQQFDERERSVVPVRRRHIFHRLIHHSIRCPHLDFVTARVVKKLGARASFAGAVLATAMRVFSVLRER